MRSAQTAASQPMPTRSWHAQTADSRQQLPRAHAQVGRGARAQRGLIAFWDRAVEMPAAAGGGDASCRLARLLLLRSCCHVCPRADTGKMHSALSQQAHGHAKHLFWCALSLLGVRLSRPKPAHAHQPLTRVSAASTLAARGALTASLPLSSLAASLPPRSVRRMRQTRMTPPHSHQKRKEGRGDGHADEGQPLGLLVTPPTRSC